MELNVLFTWVLRIFLIVMGVILIYQLLRKIIGGSWELELMLALILTNLGYSFYIGNKISEQRGWSTQFEKRFEGLERKVQETRK